MNAVAARARIREIRSEMRELLKDFPELMFMQRRVTGKETRISRSAKRAIGPDAAFLKQ